MLDWLVRFTTGYSGSITQDIRNFVHWAIHGIAGIVSTVFHQVTSAWDEYYRAAETFADGAFKFARNVFRELYRIVTYYIPHYAIYAWWWITHPKQLAARLGNDLVNWLEAHSWAVAAKLGKFTLHLIYRNIRHVAALMEDVFTAIF
jgi:hypothetical protein